MAPEQARAGIAAQRAAALAEFDLAERACDSRFMQTNCVNAAKAVRREKLDDLRRQEIGLNDAQDRKSVV